VPEFAAYPRRLQRWAINLVDAAFHGMFTRHRKGERGRQIGFPSFRSYRFWNSIGWDDPGEFSMHKRGLRAGRSRGGTLRLRPDRELPPWDKCCAIRLCRDRDRWFRASLLRGAGRGGEAGPESSGRDRPRSDSSRGALRRRGGGRVEAE
jgi:hypothetical protein